MSKLRTAYGKKTRHSLKFSQPSMTKQEFRDECNVNNILDKYQRTGIITHLKQNKGAYDDFTQHGSYQESLNNVIEAENAFMALPSSIRKKFNNDPGAFCEYVANPENHSDLVEMGLAKPKPEKKERRKAKVESETDSNPSKPDSEAV